MKKVSKDLAPIAIPHGPPVESTSEYYKSLMESSRMVKKYPVWDVARPTPQVLMEQARRDLMEADEKLALKREEESSNRALMDNKWQDLRKKEMLLKESFISFNKFIRENQEKRDRAERKMEADTEVLERKTRETEAMRQRVVEMKEVKQLMEKQVRDYTIYEDYLMSVVLNYPEFKQPLDVLNRYEALVALRQGTQPRDQMGISLKPAQRDCSKAARRALPRQISYMEFVREDLQAEGPDGRREDVRLRATAGCYYEGVVGTETHL
ncbi:coiled-coil domain-containing protein 42 homolog isoform X2 [Maniola hyperantus]|uniref:coiled-coil domain-containing protein 42 homolog isoform X2 n=1 Tax=Aphantopus hyperantus TaxID=2795564 RepID=UPI00374968D3